jgi:hypothetical protein
MRKLAKELGRTRKSVYAQHLYMRDNPGIMNGKRSYSKIHRYTAEEEKELQNIYAIAKGRSDFRKRINAFRKKHTIKSSPDAVVAHGWKMGLLFNRARKENPSTLRTSVKRRQPRASKLLQPISTVENQIEFKEVGAEIPRDLLIDIVKNMVSTHGILTYGNTGYPLCIENKWQWNRFVTAFARQSDVIAKACDVPNKFKISAMGDEKFVISYTG